MARKYRSFSRETKIKENRRLVMKKKLFAFLLLFISFFTIKNVYAETYDGEYSIEYLIQNYSVVTLGINEKNLPPVYSYNFNDVNKGDILNFKNVEGAILVAGKYSSNSNSTFGTKANGVKSYIKEPLGNNISTLSPISTDPNFIDFNKMYESIMTESQAIADNTNYYINDAKIEISQPGIYTIQNTSLYYVQNNTSYDNNIYIKNYDKTQYYIFNYYDEYIENIPYIKISEEGSSSAIGIKEYIESGKYSGNIIFNFPNAKYIYLNYIYKYNNIKDFCYAGNIIAPKANVILNNHVEIRNTVPKYYGTIVANLVKHINYYTYLSEKMDISKVDIVINKSIIDSSPKYTTKVNDYQDDYYTRDYSIKDLLENYNLITLGHKQIDSKSKLLEYGNTPGSVKIFHVTGQTLIAGDLFGSVYNNERDSYFQDIPRFDRIAFDLESNKVTESYIRGNIEKVINGQYHSISVIQPWDNMSNDNINYFEKKNKLFVGNPNTQIYSFVGCHIASGNMTAQFQNYIYFDRLYDNVVAEQSGIAEGTKLTVGLDGVLHIPTGGTYTIEDISNVTEIVFDNFEKNKEELTIITIKNGGDINFPLVSKDGNGYKGIITNDYFGKEQATHRYELDTFISEDSYYGNIVWSLPNAEYIKLKENAPFAGHMIAPNADVETPELHFAGCFIVNSIYGEGNTEAHFYPINSDLKCVSSEYDKLNDTQKKKFNDYRLKKELGGDNTIIEKEIIGDEEQYNKDIELFESLILKCENREIIINPETAGTIGVLLAIIAIAFTTLTIKSKKKTN